MHFEQKSCWNNLRQEGKVFYHEILLSNLSEIDSQKEPELLL